ncbi:MAG: hypothetical protein HKN68_14970, partial [Saprospiraceae bacterium]|nr:hypothetical protein [Saprospiraceae bacterium]
MRCSFTFHSEFPKGISIRNFHKKIIYAFCITLFSLSISGQDIIPPPPPEISGGAQGYILMEEYMKNNPNWSPTPNKQALGEKPQSQALTGLGTNFDAVTIDASGFIPPDPIGAAGQNHLVNVVNVNIEWYTKAGVQQNSQTLQTFFSSATATFDPKVIYDQYADRFVVVTLERAGGDEMVINPANDQSRILVAVSNDGDPNNGWNFLTINSLVNQGGNNY